MECTLNIQKTTFILIIASLIVIFVGLQWTGLINLMPPASINEQAKNSGTLQTNESNELVQDIYIRALPNGTYSIQEASVKQGTRVRLHFTADKRAGCGSTLVVRGLNITLSSRNEQEAIAEFIAQQPGSYTYTCGMGMFQPGNIIVTP